MVADRIGLPGFARTNHNDRKWSASAGPEQSDCVEQVAITLLPYQSADHANDWNLGSDTKFSPDVQRLCTAVRRLAKPLEVNTVSQQMHPLRWYADSSQRVDIFDALHELRVATGCSKPFRSVYGQPTG